MNPDLAMRITAQNRASAALNEVSRDILNVGKRADVASNQMTRLGNSAARSMRMASFQSRNLMFQLNDIGVSLVSGMNPLMVMAQQGSQIATIYGPEEGGLGRALQETAKMAGRATRMLGPFALAAAAGAAAVGGMTYEINRNSEAQVGFLGVLQATWNVSMREIYNNAVKPFAEDVKAAWEWMWSGVTWSTKTFVNSFVVTVGTLAYSIEWAVQAAWIALKGGSEALINLLSGMLTGFVNFVSTGINALIAGVNGFTNVIGAEAAANMFGLSTQLPTIPTMHFEVDFGDAAAEFSALNDTYGKAFEWLTNEDHAGNFFAAIRDEAIANLPEAENEVDKLASSLWKAKKEAESLAEQLMGGLKSAWTGFFNDFAQQLGQGVSAWQAFATAGLNALSSIGQKMVDLAASQLFDQIFGSVLGMGITKVNPIGLMGNSPINLLAANGNAFMGGNVVPFARGGVVNGPTLFPFAKGTGLMGEAGPEAILPLRRGPGGRLGVEAANGNGGARTEVIVRLSNELRAEFVSIANGEATRVVQSYDRQVLPASVQRINRNPMRR